MSSTSSPAPAIRWGVLGALLAAVALTLAGLVTGLTPWPYPVPEDTGTWIVIETSDVIGQIGILVTLVAVHVAQRGGSGAVERIGFWLSATGTVLLAAATLIYLLPLPDGTFLDVLFNAALLSWLPGLLLLGVGTVRARVLPRWSGWVIVGFVPLFVAAFFLTASSGWARLPIALPWLALAYALAAVSPSLVRGQQLVEDRA